MFQLTVMRPVKGENREESIANFNKAADKTLSSSIISSKTTHFTKETKDRAHISLSSLRYISLAEFEVGNTYRGCAVYCRIATQVISITSAMLLVEDNSALVDLTIYGSFDRKTLIEGLMIAIKESFYKLRSD